MHTRLIGILLGCAALAPALADVLEDDRTDLMYHRYDGGGVIIDGPAVLVRKKFAEQYAVSASYYVDLVSSASVDVVTTASPYDEERTEYGLGFEYLRGKVTYNLGFSNSKENDYVVAGRCGAPNRTRWLYENFCPGCGRAARADHFRFYLTSRTVAAPG